MVRLLLSINPSLLPHIVYVHGLVRAGQVRLDLDIVFMSKLMQVPIMSNEGVLQ